MKTLLVLLSFVPFFAKADPELSSLILEAKHRDLSPQKVQRKIKLTPETLAKLETQRLECAIKIPTNWEFQYLQIYRRPLTARGSAFTIHMMLSAEDRSGDPTAATQTALSAQDFASKVSEKHAYMSVTSNLLMPAGFVDASVPDVTFVSIDQFEGMGRNELLCTFYPIQF